MLAITWFDQPITKDFPPFAGLSRNDQEFVIPPSLEGTFNLPLLLLAAKIPVLTRDAIPTILWRVTRVYQSDAIRALIARARPLGVEEYLAQFIGVGINIKLETDYKFLQSQRVKPNIAAIERDHAAAVKKYLASQP